MGKILNQTDQSAESVTSSNCDNRARFLMHCADQLQGTIDEALHEFDALSRILVSATRVDVNPTPGTLNQLVVRLQFGDRITQRLSNIQENLRRLALSIGEEPNTQTELHWKSLLDEARANFTMDKEREAFDVAFHEKPNADTLTNSMCSECQTGSTTLFYPTLDRGVTDD